MVRKQSIDNLTEDEERGRIEKSIIQINKVFVQELMKMQGF